MKFGICEKCNAWDEVPKQFNELKHSLICQSCYSPCFFHRTGNPLEAGYTKRVHIVFTDLTDKIFETPK